MILAIDPGPLESTFLYWDERVVEKGTLANNLFFDELRDHNKKLPQLVAIESVACYGMPVGREVFETCYVIGRIVEIFDFFDMTDVVLIERPKIKLHLCGSPRAKDSNIRQALLDRVGPQGRKASPGPTYGLSRHDWSALAIAIYAHDVLLQNEVKA